MTREESSLEEEAAAKPRLDREAEEEVALVTRRSRVVEFIMLKIFLILIFIFNLRTVLCTYIRTHTY